MKGVILAGGLGTRLRPTTQVVNKHLLPIYDQPMIFYPIQTLVKAGCAQLLIILGPSSTGELMRLISNGHQFGLDNVYYAYQENPVGGIAHALSLAREFVQSDKFIFILGDNLIFDQLAPSVTRFLKETSLTGPLGQVFIKPVNNPSSFGVAEFDQDKKLRRIVEKPKRPPSKYAVTGVYLYDAQIFNLIDQLQPSTRGELEITDLNQLLIDQGRLEYDFLTDLWLDTGTFDALLVASQQVQRRKEIQAKKMNHSDSERSI